jgi:ubiquinone/menaquinone biosynthesis C-methylase UbiE
MVYIPTGKELIDPFKLLEGSGVRSGMTVADFGCGTIGHYVFPAANLVGPEGKVYAIDILKSVLNGITSRIKMESANNVETLWGDLERVNGITLPDGKLDMGFLINNLFMSTQRAAMVKECSRMVKHGGKLIIVDWKPTGGGIGPNPAQRLSAEEAGKLAEAAGLVLEKTLEPGQYHFGMVYSKP